MRKHGHGRRGMTSREFSIWRSMHQRCRCETCESYPNYGGRGIQVCERWSGGEGFQNFFADMGEKPEGMSLDRIDNDGNYCPENCRWASRTEQQRNRRACHYVTIDGETLCLADWADRKGIPIKTIYKRIHALGWSEEKAITEPTEVGRRATKFIEAFGYSRTVGEWSKQYGISVQTIRSRLRHGWEPERAVSVPPQERLS